VSPDARQISATSSSSDRAKRHATPKRRPSPSTSCSQTTRQAARRSRLVRAARISFLLDEDGYSLRIVRDPTAGRAASLPPSPSLGEFAGERTSQVRPHISPHLSHSHVALARCYFQRYAVLSRSDGRLPALSTGIMELYRATAAMTNYRSNESLRRVISRVPDRNLRVTRDGRDENSSRSIRILILGVFVSEYLSQSIKIHAEK